MNTQFSLDSVMKSIEQGGLTLITGCNATGKTAFAVQLAIKAGLDDKKSVLLFNTSLNKGDVLSRMLSPLSKIELSRLLKGGLDQEEHKKLFNEAGKLAKASIFMDDSQDVTVTGILNKVNLLNQANSKIDLVIIDDVCAINPWNKQVVDELKEQLCDKGIALVLLALQQYEFVKANKTLTLEREGAVVNVSINQEGEKFNNVMHLRFIAEYGSLA